MRADRLTPSEVRRIALGAQGFGDRRPISQVGRNHMRRAIERTGLLQIDSVNVIARAHLMPLFSRLGPYPLDLLDRAQGRKPRMLFEYWAHEASLLPVEMQPLFRWRMQRAERGEGIYKGLAHFARTRSDFIEALFREVEMRGPLAASDFEGEKGSGGWWGWSDTKRALEWLFWAGRITTHSRRPSFERLYDVPERVLPASVLDTPTPSTEEAHRSLLALAARSLGVASEQDLRDYHRLSASDAAPRIPELVEDGTLIPVEIKGWRQQAYLYREARLPRRIERSALLAPFDPVVWERSRAERIFSFRYRIEIYTPAHKRVHGYYVLPFLLGDRIAARLDLKADRAGRKLLVQSAHREKGAPEHTVDALAENLSAMRQWLGLDQIEVKGRGEFDKILQAHLES
ncbi:winged helix-turn-helix domain-containing protein [Nitratireductor indicus]|uniref:winged helix-turn-helix domain-containing protein n=1 Tax=Nitratireductor indicus TaxID=721133 RepID=UPI002874A389|nr:winged helix-turn-helix domain-containing protein [Nitratireductor indicus]MDS1134940.1 winged helix-turn-helix domain-containing protein [Nitratireductor indicus]